VLYFNDYIDTNFQDHSPDCYDESPNDENLIKFSSSQTKVSNQEIGKYVDMLMQMSDKEDSPENSKSSFTNEKNKECEKLARIILEKGIL